MQRLPPAEKAALLARLERDARAIAARFGLRFRCIAAERAGVTRRYGACFADGTIRIRLTRLRGGAPLRYSSLMDTLCHELAHLKYWHHNARFRAYHRRLLEFARQQGMYAPRRRAAVARAAKARTHVQVRPKRAPGQLALFGA